MRESRKIAQPYGKIHMAQYSLELFARRHALAILVALHVALSVYTSLAVPLWESYDEPGHVFYARYIGQTGSLPPLGTRLNDVDESHQPPLYYLLASIPFALIDTSDDVRPKYTASGHSWTVYQPEVEAWPWRGSVLAIRLARFLSIIPGTLCVMLTWRTGRVLFPKRAMIAPVAAFVHAVWPMLNFLNGVVSNDTGMALMGSLVLWQIAELVRRPRQWRWWLGLALAGVAASLTKDNGLTLLAAAIGVLGLVFTWQLLSRHSRALPMFLSALALATGAILISFELTDGRTLRQFAMATSFLDRSARTVLPAEPQAVRPGNAVQDAPDKVRIEPVKWQEAWTSTVGLYSWGTITVPDTWRIVALLLTLTAVLSIGIGLLAGPHRLEMLLCLFFVGAVFLASILRGRADFVGGRFFLPALSAIGILLAESIARVGRRAAGKAWGLALLSGLSMYTLMVPPLVLRPAYQLPEFLDPVSVPPAIEVRSTLIFGDSIELLGYSQPQPNTSVGDTAQIRLFWRVLKPIARDHGVRFEMFAIDGVSLEASWQQTPGNNNYPSSAWTAGATFADTIEIPIRPLPNIPTTGVFKITWFDQELNTILPATCATAAPGGAVSRVPCEPRVGSLRIASSPASPLDGLSARFAPPPIASYGDLIGLTRFSLPATASAGAIAPIGVQWRASGPMGADYVSFVHVLDANGKLVAQQDNQPRKSAYPTSAWRANEIVDDTLEVRLPPGLAPGDYSVRLGWFEAKSGDRLTVSADPRYSPQDRLITLGALRVVAGQP